jgi:hypothetical protein
MSANAIAGTAIGSMTTRRPERGPYRNAEGVYFHIRIKRGGLSPAWVAYWQENRKQKFKRFSFGRLRSSGEAYRLAKEWRERMIGERP